MLMVPEKMYPLEVAFCLNNINSRIKCSTSLQEFVRWFWKSRSHHSGALAVKGVALPAVAAGR